MIDDYRKNCKEELYIPAAAAASCYIKYDTTPIKDFYVAVETKGNLALGQTVVDRLGKYKKQPNIKVVVSSSKQQFLDSLSAVNQ